MQIHHSMPGVSLAVSGKLAQTHLHKTPPDVHFKRTISEVLEFVTGL
jgi:hypothetical protein